MAAKNKKEYRSAPIIINTKDAESKMHVSGYAAVFEQPTEMAEIDGIKYFEVIDRNAFAGADLSDVCFRYNHSTDVFILARTRNRTLQLTVDDKGLKIDADLADIQAGRDLCELIKRGDIDKMSFGFYVAADGDVFDTQTHTRRILKFDSLIDVSAVPFPAYDGTSISNDNSGARDYFQAQADAEKLAAENILRKKLLLRTYL